MDNLIRKRIHKLKLNNKKNDDNPDEYTSDFKENNLHIITDLIKDEIGIKNNDTLKTNIPTNLNLDINNNFYFDYEIKEELINSKKLFNINTSIIDKYINIILSGDQNVSLALSVLIKSVVLNCKNYKKIKFYIICDDPYHLDYHINVICKSLFINDNIEDRLNIEKNTIINYIMPSEEILFDINKKKSFHSLEKELKPTSDYNFIRFYFNKLLPDYINKCIYLDNDMIVKGNIEELFNLLTPEYSIGAVYPDIPYKLSVDDWIIEKKLKINLKKKYLFNAGMYIFYMKSWNYLNYTEKCIELLLKNKEKKLYDGGTQPIMNIVCKFIKEIDKSWNQTGLSEGLHFNNSLQHFVTDANIIHFTGFYKPWLKISEENTHINFFEEWFIYLIDINPRFLKFNKFIYDKINKINEDKSSNFYHLYNCFKEKLKFHLVLSQKDLEFKLDNSEILSINKSIDDNKLIIKIIFNELKNMEEVSAFLSVNIDDNLKKIKVNTTNNLNGSFDINLDVAINKESLKAKFNKKRRTITITSQIVNDSISNKLY